MQKKNKKNDALRAEWRCVISLYMITLPKYHIFFNLVLPFKSHRRYLHVSQKTNKFNLPWSSNSTGFHPLALNACFFLLEHQWAFELSVIVKYDSLSCPQCEKMDLKIIQSFKYTKMLQNQRICGTWRIFLKNSGQFNCSGQTRDSWTTITKPKNTAVDHSGNNTVLRIKCVNFSTAYFL